MRSSTLAFLAYGALLTVFLWLSDPFAAAGEHGHALRLLYVRHVAFWSHFLAFVPLGFLAMVGKWRLPRRGRLGLLISYSFLTEAVQAVIPNRTPEWRDVIQNLAGVLVGCAVWRLTARRQG